jgi:hypothetical protein
MVIFPDVFFRYSAGDVLTTMGDRLPGALLVQSCPLPGILQAHIPRQTSVELCTKMDFLYSTDRSFSQIGKRHMKQNLLIACFVLLSTGAFAQTTLEEYNYLTKGYRVQIESGLDMKKGYTFSDIPSFRISYSNGVAIDADFKALYKEGQKIPQALLCIFSRSDNPIKEYICIPQFGSSKEIWDSTRVKLASVQGEEDAGALMYGLAKLGSYYSMNGPK